MLPLDRTALHQVEQRSFRTFHLERIGSVRNGEIIKRVGVEIDRQAVPPYLIEDVEGARPVLEALQVAGEALARILVPFEHLDLPPGFRQRDCGGQSRDARSGDADCWVSGTHNITS